MKEVVTKKANDGTTIINEYDTKWIQKDGKDIGKIIKDGKTVFEAWDLARWKQYLQNNEGPVPDGLATPYALQKATSLPNLFSDGNSAYYEGTATKFYTGSFPNWRFENATSLADINNTNKSTTGHVIIDAPKCINFVLAFTSCSNIEEVTINNANPEASWDSAFLRCTNLKKVNIKNNTFTGKNFSRMFANTKVGGTFVFNSIGNASFAGLFDGGAYSTPLNVTINQAPGSKSNYSTIFRTRTLDKLVINNFNPSSTELAPGYGKHSIFNWVPIVLTSNFSNFMICNMTGLPGIEEHNFAQGTDFGPYGFITGWTHTYSNQMRSFYTNLRIRFTSLNNSFRGCPYLTQLDLDYSICTDVASFMSGTTRFDLESVQKMAGVKNDKVDYSTIGFPVTATAKTLNIGISARRLYKKFDPKYDRYDTGKTQYDANGNILYLKADGTTTTTASQAPLNNYIINSPGDRIDITTVEDTHTITNYNNYYLYVASLQYITGDMLEAVRALMDKGYTVTVKFN